MKDVETETARPAETIASRFPAPEEFELHRLRRRHVTIEDAVRAGGAVAEAARELARTIDGEVRFSDGDRALYAADASNYRQVPVGVVIPRTIDDVIETVRVARTHGIPIVSRGAGTSLAGQTVNAGIVIDCSKYLDRIVDLDVDHGRAHVQPGVILDALRHHAERYGLTFGPDTSTHAYNTLGGMIGNNSCGVRSVLSQFRGPGSRTSDHVEELDILLYDGTRMRVGATSDEALEGIIAEGGRRGEIYRRLRTLRDRYADLIRARYPDIPRRVSGYNLDDLLPENGFHVARALAGSEGTCAIVLEATLTLVDNPVARTMVLLGFDSIGDAGDCVPEVMAHEPTGVEAVDHKLIGHLRKKGLHTDELEVLPEGKGWLFVELGGDDLPEARAKAERLAKTSRRFPKPPSVRLLDSIEDEEKAWTIRESGLGATAFVPGERDRWPGWEDSAVSPERVGEYYRDVQRLFDKYGYDASLYGHIGQGLLHTRIDFDLVTHRGIEQFKAFTREAAELITTKYRGSLSGEHGDGQARGDLLPIMYGDELMEAFREFKAIWDPDGKMNPGKIVDAFPRDVNLRLGTDYAPAEPATAFQYPQDQGRFSRAALRCVGVGKCRRTAGGTMCPSFQVLREEKHTTRGRAHALFEMLRGETIRDGWRSEVVRESLDLCLSCKGCKHECPVSVDIATYKAEFMSHHYRGRLRPRAAYAFGLIPWWARLAALAPDTVNLVTQTPGLSAVAKRVAGMAPERRIPRFAARTFRDWWRGRRPRTGQGRRVVLWPDTFNDHFHPATLEAGVEVLERAGCRVVVPSTWLCCGRPLYEFGMLDLARWQLRQILDTLRHEIRAGTPVVGLEPSCVSVFRDELPNLLGEDEDARRLAEQTFTLGEFLLRRHDGFSPPRLDGAALVHGHCHHKSVLDFEPELDLLRHMGLELRTPDTGCCGMAGAFGFEAGEKYEIAVARGEQALLPAVRRTEREAYVIADGYSCREQIAQCTDRRALHTAELLQLALRSNELPSSAAPPEQLQAGLRAPELARPTSDLRGAMMIGGVALAGGLAVTAIRRVWKTRTPEGDHAIEAAAPD